MANFFEKLSRKTYEELSNTAETKQLLAEKSLEWIKDNGKFDDDEKVEVVDGMIKISWPDSKDRKEGSREYEPEYLVESTASHSGKNLEEAKREIAETVEKELALSA